MNKTKSHKSRKIFKFIKELSVFVVSVAIMLTVLSPVLVDYASAAPSGGAPGTATPIGTTPDASKTIGDAPPKDVTPTTTNTPGPGIVVPLSPSGQYTGVAHLNVDNPDPAAILKQFVDGIFKNVKYILGAFTALFIILSAIKLIIGGDNEEVVTKQKKALTYGIIGLAVIGFADEAAKVFSVACAPGQTECAAGGFVKDPSTMISQAAIFKRETRILITFIKYLIGGIAVLMLVRNGIRLIALQGKEESITIDKKNIAFTSIGLVLIIIASTVIDKVLYVVDITKYNRSTGVETGINPQRGIEEVIGISNYAVSFAAPIAILVLIAGAIMYATSAGNDEKMGKAKRMIMLALVGIAIIYGAFAIISTVVAGQFSS